MQETKTIFVTGATGNQGGAVARNLIRNNFKVKCLTRHPNSVHAHQLEKLDALVVHGDLDKPYTFSQHLKDVDGIFSVQTFVHGIEKEIRKGTGLADLAKANNIKHFLYSSVAGADLNTGIPHWESKLKIENHLKSTGIPYTIIRPASLFENFLRPQVKSRLLKGKLVSPVGENVIQQFSCADDIGKMSAAIFTNPNEYNGKTITLASEEMNLVQAAEIFSDVLGKEIKYEQLPMFITRVVMGKNLYEMFKWVNENNAVFIKDFTAYKNDNPGLTSLREWIATTFLKS
jgi:uncharacterized protein YbjT (DUF2867 family)